MNTGLMTPPASTQAFGRRRSPRDNGGDNSHLAASIARSDAMVRAISQGHRAGVRAELAAAHQLIHRRAMGASLKAATAPIIGALAGWCIAQR